jgi:hypothetical protein
MTTLSQTMAIPPGIKASWMVRNHPSKLTEIWAIRGTRTFFAKSDAKEAA